MEEKVDEQVKAEEELFPYSSFTIFINYSNYLRYHSFALPHMQVLWMISGPGELQVDLDRL